MRPNQYITRAILLGTAITASSCMMGPDFKPVDMPMPTAFRGASAATESIADLPWWKVFKNKDLQDLLTDTYQNNRDLKATMARVEKARQYITITEAPLFPWADYSGSLSKGSNYTSGNVVQTSAVGNTLTPGSIDAGISWELDIWGKTRRMTEAARADYLASEEGQRALMLSLLRQVADSYLQLLQLDEQLAIVQKSVESYSESLRLFDEQLEGQVGDRLQVASAKAALASSQAQIPAIQVQIANLENAVSVLAGRAPGRIRRSGSTRDIAYNVKVPAGIPAYILSRRPDVRQSEYQLRAANAEVGVAIANYFPTISLTAAGGLASADLRHVQGRRGGWGFGTNLTGPLFQAGKLTSSEKAAKAEFLAASNDYEQTVLNALAEVSSTLIQRAKLRNITSIQSEAVEAYQTAVKLSFERYRTGLSNYIEVLYAQQNLYPAQIPLSQYYYQHASTLVSLYTALGGGWNMSHKAIMDGPPKR